MDTLFMFLFIALICTPGIAIVIFLINAFITGFNYTKEKDKFIDSARWIDGK